MAALTNITIPTPEPYSKQDASRNQEGYYYVFLQLLATAKANGETVSFNPSTALTVDLAELIQAIQDLQFNGQEIDLGFLRVKLEGKAQGLGI